VLFSKGKTHGQIDESYDASNSPQKIQSSANALTGFEYVSYIVCKICYVKRTFSVIIFQKIKAAILENYFIHASYFSNWTIAFCVT